MIEILHVRDPDGECYIDVFVDGKPEPASEFTLVDVDPGRGYERRDWDDAKATNTTDGSLAFTQAVAEAYDSWANNQYIREDA